MELFDLTAYREMRAQNFPAKLALQCASNVGRLVHAIVPMKRDNEVHFTAGTRNGDELDYYLR